MARGNKIKQIQLGQDAVSVLMPTHMLLVSFLQNFITAFEFFEGIVIYSDCCCWVCLVKPKNQGDMELRGKSFRETFIPVKLQGLCTGISTVAWPSSFMLFQFLFLFFFFVQRQLYLPEEGILKQREKVWSSLAQT